jgi:DNA-binding transcriptional LysR family regulator
LASGQVKLIDYTRFGHVVATRHAQGRGPVDDALAAAGCQRRIVAMVPGFVDAIAVARASDLVALVPASLLRASTGDTCGFELPVSTPAITVSQMWDPRVDADPAHRWLRQCVRAVCRGEAVP